MTQGIKQSDGTTCYSGPNCRKHGGNAKKENAIKDLNSKSYFDARDAEKPIITFSNRMVHDAISGKYDSSFTDEELASFELTAIDFNSKNDGYTVEHSDGFFNVSYQGREFKEFETEQEFKDWASGENGSN